MGITRSVPWVPGNHSKNIDHGRHVLHDTVEYNVHVSVYMYNAVMNITTRSRSAVQCFTTGPLVYLVECTSHSLAYCMQLPELESLLVSDMTLYYKSCQTAIAQIQCVHLAYIHFAIIFNLFILDVSYDS